MTATYSGNPASSPSDSVRFLIGDTDMTAPLLQDEEILWEISLWTPINGGDPFRVGAACCEAIASKYAGEVSISADGVNYSGQQLQDKYMKLSATLEDRYKQMQALQGAPYAGGILVFDFPQFGTKTPSFGIGKDDNPWAGAQQYGNRENTDAYDYDDFDPAAAWPN